ncbi:alpha-2-macroglobulin [Flavobacterium sp. HSC-61S13]|uniref:alpha-2-macroglobulin family protein n=1 Tax=Flavobacterium sp. HSC-61S13 TaxID=2910963 RepID=UPI0020A0ED0F|nr:alpha-2-macroglobulin family protein [Flavobacterium sp. HSC-61S13]MCP1996172.1 uncharacterized protein YfaS (alpha-2-macroglobulin family) [Flavobacterium sp. HSC-61S13]
MKNTICLLMILCGLTVTAQKNISIEEQWKRIEEQISEGKFSSLQPDINRVLEQARKEKDYPNAIKALFYDAKIKIVTSEKDDNVEYIFDALKSELAHAKGVDKSIISGYLAMLYSTYYNENQWSIYSRTKLENEAGMHLNVWTSGTFWKTIDAYYRQALVDKKTLQKTQIKDLKDSFVWVDASDMKLNFSVYDVLVFQYSTFLNSNRFDLTKELEKENKQKSKKLLDDLAIDFQKKKYLEGEIYTRLYQFQSETSDENILEISEKYRELANKYSSLPITAYIYRNWINAAYKSAENSWDKSAYDSVLELIDVVKMKYPDSDINEDLTLLKNKITAPILKVSIEKYLIPERNNPILIKHNNINQVYVKVLKYDSTENDFGEINYRKNEDSQKDYYDKIIDKYPLIREYQSTLKAFDDYKAHTTLLNLEALPIGSYVILFSNEPFSAITDKSAVVMNQIYVTNAAVIFNKNTVRVYDRYTGKPMANKPMVVYSEDYSEEDVIAGELDNDQFKREVKTDRNGEYNLEFIDDDTEDFYFKLEGENIYYTNRYSDFYDSDYEGKEMTFKTKIFTDRGIYRPGQTLYFKGVVTHIIADKQRVKANHKVDISLRDANYKVIQTLNLITNEFGSVQGEFVLPQSGLLGNYSLQSSLDGYKGFSVEEYKRPKFEVLLDTVKGNHHFGDEIKVSGKASAFSGADIDQGKVTYRVFRQALYSFDPYYRTPNWYRNSDSVEIAFGTLLTDANGRFEIPFKAIAADQKEDKPRTYSYRVEVAVMDDNGETHTAESAVLIGDLGLSFTYNLPEVITPDQLNQFAVRVTNLNDQLVNAQGGMEIYPLVVPNRVVRDSPFEVDYQHYTEEEFIQLFPHEPYGDERDRSKWKRGSKLLETTFDTQQSTEIHFKQNKPLNDGKYIIKSWVWDKEQKIESEQFFEVKNKMAKLSDSPSILAMDLDKSSYKIGDIVQLRLYSSEQDSYAVVSLLCNNETMIKKNIDLGEKIGVFEFPVLASYVGRIQIEVLMIKYNSVILKNLDVSVLYPTQQLDIKMATLRNKLYPGAKEKWELTISGSKKDQVLAEVLAGMYDVSLDQFKTNNFDEKFVFLRSYNSYKVSERFRTSDAFEVEHNTNRLPNYYYNSNKGRLDQPYWNFYDYYFSSYRMKQALYRAGSALEGKVAGIRIEDGEEDYNAVFVTTAYSTASSINVRGTAALNEQIKPINIVDGEIFDGDINSILKDDILSTNTITGDQATSLYGSRAIHGVTVITTKKGAELEKLKRVEVRKNLRETAFFYPNLKTDKSGNVKIEFTMPESLTEWKFMAFAHTKDLQTGYFETRVKTQKDLMIVPNVPRFLREGDRVVVTAKIVNLLDGETAGQASLMLFDALTMKPIDHLYNNQNNLREFKLTASSSTAVNWEITVPKNSPPITYRMVAATADFSDAEESVLPVLTNRILLTETLPIFAKEGQRKTFELDALKNSSSKTLEHFKLTLEMTTNPIWMAVFSLPYLREYPYDCSEQLFGRLYGNTISQQLLNSNPKIKAVFDDWNSKGELKSPLEKNPDLKNILIEETPWLRDAESDTEQKKRLALLFDWNKMQNEYGVVLEKLQKRQLSNGGFSWFDGGAVNPNITLEILSGFGSLKKMGVKKEIADSYAAIEDKTLQFLDQYYYKNYLDTKEKEQGLQNDQIQYLYARSFFLDEKPLSADLKKMAAAYVSMISEKPMESALSIRVMEALILHRFGKTTEAKTILHQIKERAVMSDEMGMYWKSNQAGWQWYQTPIETQALLIEAFDEVARDEKAVAEMKIWLLKNRATNGWKSTKATTRAVYALLNTGASPLDAASVVDIWVGKQQIDLNQEAQSGSGYTKHTWNKEAISKDQATVTVDKQSAGTAWGALYWQYFEDLNKVDKTATNIKIHKQMYIATNSASGPVLKAVTDSNPIKVGDKVTVRLEVTTDRDMEFIHLKDMRASGLEPINAISGYKWGNRTAYYQETRDVATNFFIDALKKGTYVFEYELRANTAGVFSNGIATLQNMYAPEMSAHTEGVVIEIK